MIEPDGAPLVSWFGDRALQVRFAASSRSACVAHVRRVFEAFIASNCREIIDLTPAYASLLVHFGETTLSTAECEDLVKRHLNSGDLEMPSNVTHRSITVPICHDPEFAPDLAPVAAQSGLTVDEAVVLHSNATFEVAFIGFSPGFPYLTGLPAQLASPRLEKPRVRVPAGSVGIGGDQSGIYPRATSGGWKLIGRTPLNLFDPFCDEPALFAPGDKVRFTPISRAEFDSLADQIASERSS